MSQGLAKACIGRTPDAAMPLQAMSEQVEEARLGKWGVEHSMCTRVSCLQPTTLSLCSRTLTCRKQHPQLAATPNNCRAHVHMAARESFDCYLAASENIRRCYG